jgi:sigma-E factor negative regulatory protein RseA
MNDEMNDPNDRISALVDGQLRLSELAGVMADMEASPEMLSSWHVYQLIGDVMRSEDLAGGTHDLDFLVRLQAKMDQEPVSGDQLLPQAALPVATASANADVFRWKWLSGIAVSALVAVVGFGLWNQTAQTTQLQALSANPSIPAATQAFSAQSQEQVMLRDPQLDALMAAHQQLGGHSALQMPSGFLRNATFERSSR